MQMSLGLMKSFLLEELQLPQWEEDPYLQTRPRYKQIVKDLADKYPTENLLLVTHGIMFNLLLNFICKHTFFFVNAIFY